MHVRTRWRMLARITIGATSLAALALSVACEESAIDAARHTPLPIAFSFRSFGSSSAIFVADTNGSKTRVFYTTGESPAWSPDGRQLLFWVGVGGASTLFTVDEDGKNLHRLATGDGQAGHGAAWSPDGASIAFYTQPQQIPRTSAKLAVMHLDATAYREIADSVISDGPPAWTHNQRIAFARLDRGIWTVNADGTQPTQLTAPADSFARAPSWSPDGAHLAYRASVGDPATTNQSRIAVMNADGSGTRFVTDGPHDDNPTFSPDGQWILFDHSVTTTDGVLVRCHVFKVAIGGGTPVDLTPFRGDGGCSGSTWR